MGLLLLFTRQGSSYRLWIGMRILTKDSIGTPVNWLARTKGSGLDSNWVGLDPERRCQVG